MMNVFITVEILRDYLSRAGISITVSGAVTKRFRDFRFAAPGMAPPADGDGEEGDLYFVRSELAGLIPEMGLNAIVAQGAPACAPDDSRQRVRQNDTGADAPACAPDDSRCLIRADCDEPTLIAATQDCFMAIKGWAGGLYESIAAGGALSDLLELSYPIMRNPILVDDSSYQTLAFSGRYAADEFSDAEYAFQFKNGYHSSEYVSHMLGSSLAPQSADLSPKPVILSFDFLAHRTLYSAVKADGEVVAFFSMIELETPFTDGLADICEIFTRILPTALSKWRRAPSSGQKHFKNDLFLGILTGRVTDGKTMRAILEQARLTEGAHFIAYIMISEERPAPEPFLLSRIVELFSAHLGGCHAVLDGRNIVLVVRNTANEDAKERIMKINNEFFKAFDPVTGFSIEFGDLEEMAFYYSQAKAAATFGPLASPGLNAFHYSQIIGYDLLDRLSGDAERNAICHPAIRILLKHDAEKDGKLIPTLRAVIECAGDTAMAAKKLFLHRNSVYYRINQITRLTGVDLQDEEIREHLHISLRAIDINEARAGDASGA
jgi:DNA-binding PucR family transcriptional regulator